ncbi:MAG TPA: glutamate racemase [Clostridiales bacterium]|nr:glutamate racemase [Clostridiales bacterium]
MDSAKPIGVFDSGVGGLTVVDEIMQQLPGERIIYFGDTARVPYGNKSKKSILKYSKQIVNFLMTKNVKAIVIACNTASAFALDEIASQVTIPIIGVVKPGARTAAAVTKNNNIGVIGTNGTINSGMYQRYLNIRNPEVNVFGKACPLFVPLVEEGWVNDSITKDVASKYLKEFSNYNIDTLVLGCTHYPLLREIIALELGKEVELVNPAYETAKTLNNVLENKNIKSKTLNGKHEFYVSDGVDKFNNFADGILPHYLKEAKEINIDEYSDSISKE